MRTFVLAPVAAALLGLSASSAHALAFHIDNYGDSVTVHSSWANVNESATGGAFNITTNNTQGSWPGYVPGSFVSFCVELVEHIYYPPQNLKDYSLKGSTTTLDYAGTSPTYAPISASQMTIIGQLMTQSYATFGSTWDNKTNGTAIQAAIWEVVYERPVGSPANASPFTYSNFDLAKGEFTASGSNLDATAVTTINKMFTVGDATYLGRNGFAYTPYAVLHSSTQQDFLAPVPEPEGYALAFAGLACVGLFGRKFRTAKKA